MLTAQQFTNMAEAQDRLNTPTNFKKEHVDVC